jgi:hypothetical protein
LTEIPGTLIEYLRPLGPRFIGVASSRIHPVDETLGHWQTTIPIMNAAVLYSARADPEIVAKSVEVILQDLRIRIESKKAE